MADNPSVRDPAPRSAGFAAPAVSLPKGGGAIRGIGETFSNNPATGTGGLSIPLPVSPGRSGFTPALTLAYDSGAGNGPYGFGWTVGLPAITRRTDRGVPRYLDDQESDVFLLSGAEDLVPVLRGDGTRHIDLRDGHRVTRYRPRREGLFARIERWVDASNSANVFWRTISRDNITTYYGKTAASRIVDPQDPWKIFSWLVCESFDDKGNAAVYDYVAEDEDARGTNRYLKRVRYGNRVSRLVEPDLARMDWLFELIADYGDHDDDEPSPSPSRAWPLRPDPFSTYRAGFEVRTHRRCQRFLMFHRFEELAPAPQLVRTLVLDYDDLVEPDARPDEQLAHPGSTSLGSFLRRAIVIGHGDGGATRALPPLELTYSRPALHTDARTLDRASTVGLPGGVDGVTAQWLDLDGEGLAGVFSEHAGAWWYKRNHGDAELGPPSLLARRPAISGRAQFLDLAGDGQLDAVTLEHPVAGFFERDDHAGWSRFTPLASQPNVDAGRPDLRLVDLTGDGLLDIAISDGGELSWHPSLGETGFGPRQRVPMPVDERSGPQVVFQDPTALVAFADMSGDGLADCVRIRNGEVCYWPNLGYGRFGTKITMEGAPVFDAADRFDPRRLRLSDIDGSGVTDLVYLASDGARIYFNRAGNGFTAAHRVGGLPLVDNVATVTIIDLLGTGTACLVWSSPLPGHAAAPIHFVDLMGGVKPHLLVSVENNLGARTTITYAASTKFYLADQRAGRPWRTRLPFPVHVVEKTETIDEISKHRFVRRFAYHDGYFDGVEREFRGFGTVEQRDTDELSAVPPVLTRTRFHVGAEQGDALLPPDLTVDEHREAVRALAGAMLRQEVFALDGTEREPHPYSVTEQRLEVRRVQPRGPNRHGVFLAFPHESVVSHTERRPEDPRIVQRTSLEVDELGNVLLAAAVAYGRQQFDARIGAADRARQAEAHITFVENRFTNAIDTSDDHRPPVPCESRTFEVTGLGPSKVRYSAPVLHDAWHHAATIDYEVAPTSGLLERRTIEHTRTLYRRNDLSGPAALGHLESLALPFEAYRLALTPGLAATALAGRVGDVLLADDGGYVHSDGDDQWWVPSGRIAYATDPSGELGEARAHFFAPRRYLDPFGNAADVTLDAYDLLITETRDALGNRVVAANDYRVLAARRVTDPNGNRSEVAFDALGLVVATAVMGKLSETRGDSLDGVLADLPDAVIRGHLEAPLDDPHALLGRASTRLIYDLAAYQRTKTAAQPSPAVVYTLARETHDADLALGERAAVQCSLAYSDGFGRITQSKVLAKAGPDGARRWIASGWTVFDNKGRPVRTFEPFFADSHRYAFDARAGVSTLLFYDPVGRVIGTLRPDHTWDKVLVDAWRKETWDANDTVLLDPRADVDLGSYFARLADDEYLPTWHALRAGGALGPDERVAAEAAAEHAATPTIVYLDALARVFLTVAQTGSESLTARVLHDIEGNQREVVDALERVCVRYDHDLAGRRLHQSSMEAGERWMLPDVTNQPIAVWDSLGREIHTRYDELRRPLETRLGSRILTRTEYGESAADPELRNLRGRAIRQFDQAGITTTEEHDFKGNLISSSRQLARDYKGVRDWSGTVAVDDEVFEYRTQFDALNRPVVTVAPDGSVSRPRYDAAGLPEQVDVNLRGASSATPFITNIDYNARGQKITEKHGNGVRCTYAYDPRTFRLAEKRTARAGDGAVLQDLRYSYDPVGNITSITDAAQQTIYFANQVVSPTSRYRYDATYRLIAAEGREHIGQARESTWDDPFRTQMAHHQDGQAMRRYAEAYRYDGAGNLLALVHRAQDTAWTRAFQHGEASQLEPNKASNRLSSTTVGSLSDSYRYDVHGNVTAMPHLSLLAWNVLGQLEATSRQAVSAGVGEVTYYVYDASGQRVRKVTERQNGTRKHERLSLPGFEVYRELGSDGAVGIERETLHVTFGQPVALVETRVGGDDSGPAQLVRYQHRNHSGSACLEVDARAQVISYEEYYPYGSTSYQAVRSQTDVPKRYRFAGMERDSETGFTYHGARYYACWLGRWASCDPSGAKGGLNLFAYCSDDPINRTDTNGADWGWINPGNWCNPFSSECNVVVDDIGRGAGKAAYHTVKDTGTRVVDMTTMANSAFGKWTGLFDVGYTEWSPEAKKYDPDKSVAENMRGNLYDNTVGGTVQLAKGIAEGDPESIGAGLFAAALMKAGGGGNPTATLRAPAVAMARTPLGLAVPVVVARTVQTTIPASEALAASTVGTAMMMSGGDGGGGDASPPASSTGGTLAKKLGGTTPIPRGTNLALGMWKHLEDFVRSPVADRAVHVRDAYDAGFVQIAVAAESVLKGNFATIVDTFIKNGGRIKFDLTGLDVGRSGVTTWELQQILGKQRWEAATDFFRDGKPLTGTALQEALKPWR